MVWTGGIVKIMIDRFPLGRAVFFIWGHQSRLLGGQHKVVMKKRNCKMEEDIGIAFANTRLLSLRWSLRSLSADSGKDVPGAPSIVHDISAGELAAIQPDGSVEIRYIMAGTF